MGSRVKMADKEGKWVKILETLVQRGGESIERLSSQFRWRYGRNFCMLEVAQFIKNGTDGQLSKSSRGNNLKGMCLSSKQYIQKEGRWVWHGFRYLEQVVHMEIMNRMSLDQKLVRMKGRGFRATPGKPAKTPSYTPPSFNIGHR